MCSYNKINGTYASENELFMTDILRGEWDFDGYMMTDWGACDNPVDSVAAGMDLCMPGPDRTMCGESRRQQKMVPFRWMCWTEQWSEC